MGSLSLNQLRLKIATYMSEADTGGITPQVTGSLLLALLNFFLDSNATVTVSTASDSDALSFIVSVTSPGDKVSSCQIRIPLATSGNIGLMSPSHVAEIASLAAGILDLQSSKQDKLTPGRGISIEGNTVSCTLDNQIFEIVDSLPSSNINTNKIYLLREASDDGDHVFIAYSFVNGEWETIGQYKPEINLSQYLTKEEATSTYAPKSQINTLGNLIGNLSSRLTNLNATVTELESGQGVVDFATLAGTDDPVTISVVAYVLDSTREDSLTQRYLKRGSVFTFFGESGEHEAWLLVDPDNVTDTTNAWRKLLWGDKDLPDAVVQKSDFSTTIGSSAGGTINYGSAFGYTTTFEGDKIYIAKTGSVQDAVNRLILDMRQLETVKASVEDVNKTVQKPDFSTTIGISAGGLIERRGVTHGEGEYGSNQSISDAFRGVYEDLVAMDDGLVALENAVANCAPAEELARVDNDYDARCEELKEEKLNTADLKTVNGVSLWGGSGGDITDLEVLKLHMLSFEYPLELNQVAVADCDANSYFGIDDLRKLAAAIESGKAMVLHYKDGNKHISSAVSSATCEHNTDGTVKTITLYFYYGLTLYELNIAFRYGDEDFPDSEFVVYITATVKNS